MRADGRRGAAHRRLTDRLRQPKIMAGASERRAAVVVRSCLRGRQGALVGARRVIPDRGSAGRGHPPALLASAP